MTGAGSMPNEMHFPFAPIASRGLSLTLCRPVASMDASHLLRLALIKQMPL